MRDFTVTLANRKTPWESGLSWSAGQEEQPDVLTSKEMLEAAGMAGWNVQKQPLFTAAGQQVPRAFANVAEDGRILGVVGRTYVVHQIEDVFAFGDNMVDSGEAKWGRAGGFNGGSIVFGCMELTRLGVTVPGDDGEVKPYLLLVNTFDMSYPTQGVLAWVRPVCQNTFQAAIGTSTPHRFSIRHTGGLEGKVQMAREAIGIAFKHAEETQELISALALHKVVDRQVKDIFRKVWPVSKGASEATIERATFTKVFENYMTSPTVEPIRGTAWGAFNAATEYLDHEVKYAGKEKSTAEDIRGTSLIWGTGELKKEAVLAKLVTALRS